MELGLDVRVGEEPTFPAVEGLGKARAVEVERHAGPGTREAEAERVSVQRYLEGRELVLVQDVRPLLDVVVAEKVKGLWKSIEAIVPRSRTQVLICKEYLRMGFLWFHTVGHCGDLLRLDHVLAVVPEGHVLLVVRVGVGRTQADGGVTPVGEEATSIAEGPEKLC